MFRLKKAIAVLLALVMVVAVSAVAASAEAVPDDAKVGSESSTPTNIVIHVRQEGLAQPYLYLWNSLPTNSAMSKSYPGEKMVSSGKWFNYVVKSITKVKHCRPDRSRLLLITMPNQKAFLPVKKYRYCHITAQ